MEFIRFSDKAAWDRFVATSPQANVFCTSQFLDAMNVEYETCGMIDSGRPLVGAILLRDGEKVLSAPYPLTMYQGVLFAAESSTMPSHKRTKWQLDVLERFLTELENRTTKISFCLSCKFDDLRAFQWFHYHERPKGVFRIDLRYTGILDLRTASSPDEYAMMIRSVRRQEMRKAQSAGFTIETEQDVELLNDLHALTFERQGIDREAEEERMLRAVVGAAIQQGFGELLVCHDSNGQPASATVFLFDDHCGYYYISATDPKYRNSGSGTLLMMENIRRSMGRGLSTVDFVGINSPNRGDFKTSFNAQPVPYFAVTWEQPEA